MEQGQTLAAHDETLSTIAQAVGALVAGQAQHAERLEALTDAVTTLTAGQGRHDQVLDTHGQHLAALATGQEAILAELRRWNGGS